MGTITAIIGWGVNKVIKGITVTALIALMQFFNCLSNLNFRAHIDLQHWKRKKRHLVTKLPVRFPSLPTDLRNPSGGTPSHFVTEIALIKVSVIQKKMSLNNRNTVRIYQLLM